jgi:hypothetical protein
LIHGGCTQPFGGRAQANGGECPYVAWVAAREQRMAATTEYPEPVEPAQTPTFYITGIESIDSVECCTHVAAYMDTFVDGKPQRRINVRLIFPTHSLPAMVGQAVAYLHEATEAAARTTN